MSTIINASPGKVFSIMDDLGVTGMHMTKSSGMMMGSKLRIKYLSSNHTGLGSMYQWYGKVLGMKLDFTVHVTKYINGIEKTWETTRDTKMIIMSWFMMHLMVLPFRGGTRAALSISYERPAGWIGKFLSYLFAGWYCRWCLMKMVRDTKKKIEMG